MSTNSDVLCGEITNCQICSHDKLELTVGFGHQPPVHALLTPKQLIEPEVTYPLFLYRCVGCGLVQLGYAVAYFIGAQMPLAELSRPKPQANGVVSSNPGHSPFG